MNLVTSSQFASAAASGTDWRDTSRSVLEQLESVRTEGAGFNIGFLYISDFLADDADSILALFRSVTGIEKWVGACGLGVCGAGREYIDVPAISAMIGCLPQGQFRALTITHEESGEVKKEIAGWMEKTRPGLIIAHGDPAADNTPNWTIGRLAEMTEAFVVGGLSSSRGRHVHFGATVMETGFSALAFGSDIAISTALSQGCQPIGGTHTVTRADGNVILELDGQSPFSVFAEDLRAMALRKTGKDPDKFLLEEGFHGDPSDIPEELRDLFKGDIHVAFPVAGSDQHDYLVRVIVGIDPDSGYIGISQTVQEGEHILFVHRDDETVRGDLSRALVALRNRIQREQGTFAPKAAHYVSCAARAMSCFGEGRPGGEMALVREIIGDVPLTGFYAAGEIYNSRLYGFTGILTLFL